MSLFALGFGALIEGGLKELPALLMAAGAFAGGIATLLPAISTYLDRRQARRHAAAEFEARRALSGEASRNDTRGGQ